MTRINQTFEDHVALDESIHTLRKVTIPTWAVEGISDLWVDPLSAGIGLASSRRKVVRGSHTSIVKPADRTADAYSWIKARIATALHRFIYDVFIAAAMAGHKGDAEYAESRNAVLALIEGTEGEVRLPVGVLRRDDHAQHERFRSEGAGAAHRPARNAGKQYFILYYPQKIASSVLYEAGWR